MRGLQTLLLFFRKNTRWHVAFGLLTCSLFMVDLCAQPIDTARFGSNHRDIERFIKAENYSEARELIAKQVAYLQQIGAYDSLYLYTYYTGRAWWKTGDAETGMAKIESLNFFRLPVEERQYKNTVSTKNGCWPPQRIRFNSIFRVLSAGCF